MWVRRGKGRRTGTRADERVSKRVGGRARRSAQRSGRRGAKAGLPRRSAERSGRREGGSNSVVESQPSKLLVAGSIPVSRSRLRSLALPGELRLGKPAHRSRSRRSGEAAKADFTASPKRSGQVVRRSW